MHEYKITDISKKKDEKKIVELVKSLIPEPIKGEPGKDADEQKIIEEVLQKIPKPKDGNPGKSFTKKQVKDLIEVSLAEKMPELMAELEGIGKVTVEELKNGFNLIIDGKKYFVGGSVVGPKLRLLVQMGDLDLPNGLVGQASKVIKVKTNETGFELGTVDTDIAWGQITGTLSDQTDLQTALNAKQATLVSGTNIKTINSTSLLGSGNIDINSTPGGSTTQVQFNDAGAFGGDAGFTYNKTTDTVSVTKTSLGATPTAGLQVINSTAATVGTPSQVSPSFLRKGNGFFSNSSTSFPFEVQDYVSGDTNIIAYGKHIWQYRANSGSWAEFMSFSTAPLGLGFSITPGQSLSNGTPGTTRNMTINNTGTNSWIDWKFSGVAKSYLGADSSGAMKFYAGGGSYFEYYQMSGNSLFSYNYPTAFVHSGNGLFGGSVNAGSQSTPTSTLQSQGSFATKGRRVTSNYTLTTTDSVIYADATTPTCNGTPSAICASWTNQTDCEKWDAHGGCSWYAGDDCSVYNGDQSGCEGQSGCTYETANCSVYNGDESTCSGTSGCTWGGTDCSPLNESECGTYSGSGCTVNTSDCSAFNGNESGCSGQSGCSVFSSNTCSSQGDESSCTGAGCTWDGMSCTGDNSTCTGSYFTGCTGTYYTCSGSYYTGTCSGTYGAGCQGTSACAGIDDSTNCGFETGCTWTTSITINLPSVVTAPERHYWIYNDNTGSADVVLSPFSGDTIDKTTSYTLGTYKDSVHIHALAESTSCDSFNEGACTPSGCTKVYSNCSWDSMSSTCSGNAVCDGIGDQGTCESTTYFSSCSGNYYSVKNWYLLSRS